MLNVFKNRRNSKEEQIDELLSSYLDGVLPLNERESLEIRLQQDSALVTRLGQLRQTKKALANLPNIGVPRNFILSPSMVAPARPTVKQRPRAPWSVFGWATAAVTVLFLLVFAADVFSPRPGPDLPTQIFAQGADMLAKTAEATGPAPAAPEALAVESEAAVELEMEAKVAPAMETPDEPVEKEAAAEGLLEEQPMAEAQVPEPIAEAEAPPVADASSLTSGETRQMLTEAASAATVETEPGRAQATAPIAGTATPGPEGTPPADVGTAVGSTNTPEAEAAAKEISPVASPQAAQDEQDSERPTAIALLMATPKTAGTTSTSDGRFWLRLSEFGLGAVAISLAVITFVLRRRQR